MFKPLIFLSIISLTGSIYYVSFPPVLESIYSAILPVPYCASSFPLFITPGNTFYITLLTPGIFFTKLKDFLAKSPIFYHHLRFLGCSFDGAGI